MAKSTDRMRFVCPHCDYRARIPSKYTGQTISCPGCQKAVEAQPADDEPATGTTQEVNKPEAAGKFRFVCDDCGYRARIPVKYAGMAIKCPGCGSAQMADESTEAAAQPTGGTVEVRKVDLSGGGERFLFQCGDCGYRARLPTAYHGEQIKCPGCNAEQVALPPEDPGPSTGSTVNIDKVDAPVPQAALAAAQPTGQLDLGEPSSDSLDLGGPSPDAGMELDLGGPTPDASLELGEPGPAPTMSPPSLGTAPLGSIELDDGGSLDLADSSLDLDSEQPVPISDLTPTNAGAIDADEALNLDQDDQPEAAPSPASAPAKPAGKARSSKKIAATSSSGRSAASPSRKSSAKSSARGQAKKSRPIETDSDEYDAVRSSDSTSASSIGAIKSKLPIVAWALAGLLLIMLIVVSIMWSDARGKIANLENLLSAEERAHSATQTSLSETKDSLSETRQDLKSEQQALTETQAKLDDVTSQITSLNAQVSITKDELQKAQAEAARLKQEADDLADKQLDAEREVVAIREQLKKIQDVALDSRRRIEPALLEAIGIEE